MPRTVAIVGDASVAIDLALRRVLRFKEFDGPVVVLDSVGRGAAVLDKSNIKNMLNRPVAWFDLANRQRPVALFQISRSDGMRDLMARALQLLFQVAKLTISNETLSWATDAACRLSEDGKVGLAALLRSLTTPEVWRWFSDSQPDPSDHTRLVEVLAWALNYPAVYAISEGSNLSTLGEELARGATIWIEALGEHFEPTEHWLVTRLAELAVDDSIRKTLDTSKKDGRNSITTVLHLLPQNRDETKIPSWVRETHEQVRHVSVHHLYRDRALKPLATGWAREASEVWVLNPKGKLDAKIHGNWLKPEEIERISGLAPGELWIRANDKGQALVVQGGTCESSLKPAHEIRFRSARDRRPLPVRQIASAVKNMDGWRNTEHDLYRKFCDPEMLRNAWFKVQAGSNGAGVDNITVASFKEDAPSEIARLSDELRRGKYRCRPLRRIYLPKSDGTQRPIGIGCVRDRIVQAALLLSLEPIFEPSFSHFSFAFRPRRSAHHALAVARSFIASGRTWAVIADIQKCFDNIDHEVLLRLVSRRIADSPGVDRTPLDG